MASAGRSRHTIRNVLPRVAVLLILGGSSVAKLASPHSDEFVLPEWGYYATALAELVLACLILTRWTALTSISVMILCLGGILFALLRRDGECGCWGGWIPSGRHGSIMVLAATGALAGLVLGQATPPRDAR